MALGNISLSARSSAAGANRFINSLLLSTAVSAATVKRTINSDIDIV